LYNLEQRYGSLIKGQVLGARARKRRAEVSKQNAQKLSFDNGLQVLPDTLAGRLAAHIQLRSPVARLERRGEEWVVTTRADGQEHQAPHSAVIYAAPPFRLPEIQTVNRDIDYSPLSKIYYPPVATLVLGFRREDVGHPLDGFGMLIPEVEGFNILGTLFSSSLFPNRAPAGHVTLTNYIGGARAPHLAESDLETLLNLTLHDLRVLLGVRGQPTFVHHALFRHAIPQYDVGYGRFKDLMTEIERSAPGLFFAGHYRDGIALSDSIVSGDNAARKAGAFVTSAIAHHPSRVAA
jgi:oxygen-dependent protoporphyrinogen oxidase